MPAMKQIFVITASALLISGCSENGHKKQAHFPQPGSVVAQASMPVKEDELNHSTFSVKVIADSEVAKGVYQVDADFGTNYANGKLTLPKGAEDAKPDIRTGNTPYTYIIGFRLEKDTTFYEYFEVMSTKETTKMRYTKAYTF